MDVAEVMLRLTQNILGCRIGVGVVKEKAEEVDQNQEWNVSNVASTTMHKRVQIDELLQLW